LKHVAERYELGGIVDFKNSLEGGTKLRATKFSENKSVLTDNIAVNGGKAIIHHIDSVATLMDNLYRDGVYSALVENGMTPKSAEAQAKNIINFSQRVANENMRGLLSMYSFAASGLTGVHTTFSRRLWKGNEAPNYTWTDSDGNTVVSIDWSRAWSQLSKQATVGYMATGAGSAAMSAILMGAFSPNDEDNDFKRTSAVAFMRKYVLGVGPEVDGHVQPLAIPIQYGVQSLFSGMGALATLAMIGSHTKEDLTLAAAELFVSNLVPIGNINPTSMYDSYRRDGVTGLARNGLVSLSPTAVAAEAGVSVNRSTFGQQIFKERVHRGNFEKGDAAPMFADPQANSAGVVEGYNGTGAAWKEMAEFFSDVATKAGLAQLGVDALNLDSPEAVRFLADQNLPMVGFVDSLTRDVRAMAENPDSQRFVPFLDRSGNSYERNRVDTLNLDYLSMERDRLAQAYLDNREYAVKRGKAPSDGFVGDREKQWKQDNPDWSLMKDTLDKGFKELGKLSEQRKQLLDAGDYEKAHSMSLQARAIYTKMADEIDEKTKD
jgi:hypothetical protein